MKKDLNSLLEKRAARNGENLDPEDVAPEPDDTDVEALAEDSGKDEEPVEAAPKSFGEDGSGALSGPEGTEEPVVESDDPAVGE